MNIMTKEKAQAIRDQFAQATRKWAGETVQVFANEQKRAEHLAYVEREVKAGNIPF